MIGKVYKLINETTGEIYIGSTRQKYLSTRLASHKCDAVRKKNPPTSSQFFKNDNKVSIILIEQIEINSVDELHMRERFHIENNVCVNKYIPSRKQSEYSKTDNCKESKKKYRIKDRERQNTKINCKVCDKLISFSNMKRHIKTIHKIIQT